MAKKRAKPDQPTKPPDLTGFLVALPEHANASEVAEVARAFGIKGNVVVTSWDGTEPSVGLSILEGDPYYSVTRWPRDAKVRQAIENGIASRLAEFLVNAIRSESMEGPLDKAATRARDCDRFIDALTRATANVESIYFKLPLDGGDAMYRERVYCYELYHQLRRRLDRETEFPYALNGEVDKRSHPVLRELELEKIPDFLVHDPGTPENLVVMEVKPSDAIKPHTLRTDLDKLSGFVSSANYEMGSFIDFVTPALLNQSQQHAVRGYSHPARHTLVLNQIEKGSLHRVAVWIILHGKAMGFVRLSATSAPVLPLNTWRVTYFDHEKRTFEHLTVPDDGLRCFVNIEALVPGAGALGEGA